MQHLSAEITEIREQIRQDRYLFQKSTHISFFLLHFQIRWESSAFPFGVNHNIFKLNVQSNPRSCDFTLLCSLWLAGKTRAILPRRSNSKLKSIATWSHNNFGFGFMTLIRNSFWFDIMCSRDLQVKVRDCHSYSKCESLKRLFQISPVSGDRLFYSVLCLNIQAKWDTGKW